MTGCIILPCGHEDELLPHGIPLWFKDMANDGGPAILYTQYCRGCLKELLDDEDSLPDVFFSHGEAEQWVYEEFSHWSKSKKHQHLREAEQLEQRAKELRSRYEE